MDNLFKQTAVDIYLENLKSKMPSFSQHDLKIIEYAFETGFNVGACNNSPSVLQEVALLQLSK